LKRITIPGLLSFVCVVGLVGQIFGWMVGDISLGQKHSALTATDPKRPALSLAQADDAIHFASHGVAHAKKLFSGPDGLVGVVIEDANKGHAIVWLTPHGEAVLNGAVIDLKGADLSRAAMFSQGLLLSPARVLQEAAEPSHQGIVVGTAGPLITVLFDPNCIFCHQLYLKLQPEVAAGHVRVRYVVVGTLKETSVPRAVSLLAAKDRTTALQTDEDAFDTVHEEGGYPIAPVLNPALKSVVEANNALFAKSGAVGTPATFYCAKSTKDAQVTMGMPVDINTYIAQAADTGSAACR
jgi:thiol:disulfide interchange protein DsbG